jgi:hypothetical protein
MASLVSGNKIPLYHQVAQSLKQRVRTGVYQSGKALPSFRTLSDEFGVSLKVVQRAVCHLEEEGVLVTHHGKGMKVMEENLCEQAAILFGLIEPFETCMGFESHILRYAEKIFGQRNNFMVTRSSEGSFEREKAVAEHFVQNGVKGILLWPVDNDPNGKFFKELSKRIPVVLVDRMLEGIDLPAVMSDVYDLGRTMCHHMLETTGHRRLLILMDNLKISSYDDFMRGVEDEAAELGRIPDMTILQMPISKLVHQFNKSDFSQVQTYKNYVERVLREGKYDALYCMQDEIIDFVVIETGLYDQFKGLQLGTTRGPGANTRSLLYNQTPVFEWMMDHAKVMETAADMLQQWVFSRHSAKDVIRIKVELKTK